MKKHILFSLLFSLLCLMPKMAFSIPIAGTVITYKQIDSLKYEVTVKMYRDCRSLPLTDNQTIKIRCTGIATQTRNLSRSQIEDVTPVCNGMAFPCKPANSRAGEGIEEHTFLDTLDFNISPLNAFANCNSRIIISSAINARNGAITTGPSGTLYVEAELYLNRAPNNSSPQISTLPKYFMSCNQPVYYNMGAQDTIDNDSLSYSFVSPKRDYQQNTAYSSGFAYDNPITPYYPGWLTFPFSNPEANPPIGISLNPETGDLIFTPTRCWEVTVIALQVTEWRKDTTGTYQIIGKITQDMMCIVQNYYNNNPPQLLGARQYDACEGSQICFDITTSDQVFVPPPPASPPAPDTTTISWNNGIKGATFTVLSDTVLNQTGRFCWTPPIGSASTLPYQFTAQVKDNACRFSAVSSSAFQIRVRKTAKTATAIDSLTCGYYNVTSSIDSANFEGIPRYSWQVLDANLNAISDKSIAYFESTGNVYSAQNTDSLKIQREGTYVIKHTINNAPFNCSSYYYDTLIVGALATTTIDFPKDTVICSMTDFTLNSSTINASSTLHYQWYSDNTLLTNDTAISLSVVAFDTDTAIDYKVVITDINGCTNSDHITAVPNAPYQDKLESLIIACIGDSVVFELDASLYNVLWSNGATTNDSKVKNSTTLGVEYTDSFGCKFSDSSVVDFKNLPTLNLSDSTFCGSSASVSPGDFATYTWSTGDTISDITIDVAGVYSVHVADSFGCKNTSTATFQFLNKVGIDLGRDTTNCGPLMLRANTFGSYNWSTGSTTASTRITQSGTYSLTIVDSDGCSSSDDISVTINPLPQQSWTDTLAFCSDNQVIVTSDPFSSYRWSTGATSRSIQTGSGLVSITFTGSNGCKNKDTAYIEVSPFPVFNLGADTTFCGNSLYLSESGGRNYLWSTGEVTNVITAKNTGAYWLTLTDDKNCSFTDSINIELLVNDKVPVLTRRQNEIKSDKTGLHRWFANGVLMVGEAKNFILVSSGNKEYSATTIDLDGCESKLSNMIKYTTGVALLSSDNITVYPNPNNGSISISLGNILISEIKTIKLYDVQGKEIKISQTIAGQEIKLSWTGNSGILWLTIETQNGVYRKEIVYIK